MSSGGWGGQIPLKLKLQDRGGFWELHSSPLHEISVYHQSQGHLPNPKSLSVCMCLPSCQCCSGWFIVLWWDWTMWLLSLFLFYKVKFFFEVSCLLFYVIFRMKLSNTKKKYCWDLRFLVWLHWIYRSDRRVLRKTKLSSCLMEHKSKIVSNTRHIEYKDNKYVESLGKH